jgi:hypothetical protein
MEQFKDGSTMSDEQQGTGGAPPGDSAEAPSGANIDSMTPDDIVKTLKELTFEVKDKTINLPMGDKVAVAKAFAPLLQAYCDIVPKVAAKAQDYFKKNNVPVKMIKAMDVYYYELKRAMRKYPEVLEDPNLKVAIESVITPFEKVIQAMTDIARKYSKQRGQNYDTDF